MADITWLANRLRGDSYLSVSEVSGWTTRKRPGSFSPKGVLIHHTGVQSKASNPAPALNTVIDGRSDLPGPLCHVLIDYNGKCRVVAAGRANHAGLARKSGPMPEGDGNTMYVGIEVDYAPQEPIYQDPTEAQWVAAVNAAAAIVSKLGQGGSYVRYHRETSTTGKWDPGGGFPSASAFRSMVDAVIANRW